MEEANKSKIFQGTDVNLKFNKPELSITIDREKARSMGVSVSDIAQTLQLALSGQRFGYFIMQGKQYQVIGQVDRPDRDAPYDLSRFYVRNAAGELIQLDNVITVKEVSSPPQLLQGSGYSDTTGEGCSLPLL